MNLQYMSWCVLCKVFGYFVSILKELKNTYMYIDVLTVSAMRNICDYCICIVCCC